MAGRIRFSERFLSDDFSVTFWPQNFHGLLMSTSESWKVNRHTMWWCTIPVCVVSA